MFKRFSFIVVIVLFALCFFFTNSTYAEPTEDNELSTAATIEISPVIKRIKLNPNEKQEGTITVKNTSKEPLKVAIYATPYSDNEDGTRNFEATTSFTQLSQWITIKSPTGEYQKSVNYTIYSNETKDISYKISIPEFAGGGQYAVLFVETVPDDNTSNPIQTSSRVGMTIYATINGEIIRSAEISEIHAGTTSDKKIGVQAKIITAGNIDFQASINLTVSSAFGKTLYNDSVIQAIFPETTREVNITWKDTPFFGLYRISYTVKALDEVKTEERLVLVTPIPLIILAPILAVVIVLLIRTLKNKRRQRI